MCDYSMEHVNRVDAKEGETYQLNAARFGHGFRTKSSTQRAQVAVCVLPGQRLQLTGVKNDPSADHPNRAGFAGDGFIRNMPEDCIVTVVSARTNPKYQAIFGFYNDGIEWNGQVQPLAYLQSCKMELLPFLVSETPKVKMSVKDVRPIKVRRSRRNLDKLLNLGQTRVPTVKERQLVDD